MAWNEPGGKNRDPWGNRKNDGLPDLDEMFKTVQNRLSRFFGKQGGDSNGNAGFWLLFVLSVAVILWALYGFNIIKEEERGVVLRFGKFIDTRLPGLNWIPPIISSLEKVNVSTYRSTAEIKATMLTEDENIVDIAYSVQYNVKSPEEYLFNVRDPNETLVQASESAMREVVGANKMDYILTDGRDDIPVIARSILQGILDHYQTGFDVITVNLTKAKEPEAVKHAFDDATKAREDKIKFIRESEAYRNGIIPQARGEARNLIEQAKGYKVRVINHAKGEAARFEDLLTEYRKAPDVTRRRIYIDNIESVLAGSSKVFVDVEGGNNLLYLPIDKLIQDRKATVTIEPLKNFDKSESTQNYDNSPNRRSNLRKRGSR